MGGGSNTQTTTGTSAPWKDAQPFLKQIYGGAQDAYESGEGFKYYPDSTVVPFASQTQNALGQIENLAGQGNPMAQAASTQATDILNSGGMSDWQRGALDKTYDIAQGNRQITAASDNLGGYASGDYVNGGSDAFNAALDRQAGKLATDVNRSVDMMGRGGSVYHSNALAESLGDFRQNAMLQELARQERNQMQAVGMLGQEQGANLSNMVGAGSQINAAGNQAMGQVAQFAGLAPNIYESQFQPAERLASVGAQYEDQSTRELQDDINRYNTEQQEPWSQLAAYNALLGGAGQLGSQKTESVQKPTNYLGGAAGGALGGAQIGSTFGMPWLGAGLGGLAGLLM